MEVHISREMIAAGVEAKREAWRDCFTEVDLVKEIYMAMYLHGVKAMCEGEETVH